MGQIDILQEKSKITLYLVRQSCDALVVHVFSDVSTPAIHSCKPLQNNKSSYIYIFVGAIHTWQCLFLEHVLYAKGMKFVNYSIVLLNSGGEIFANVIYNKYTGLFALIKNKATF